jgi:putative membrane protein
MGLGDSVPGISGGTIAVITQIYDELIYSIRSFDLHVVQLFAAGKFRELWRHVNGSFLLLVALGMLSGLLLSANTVLYLLAEQRVLLMAFFVGLVLASVVLLSREIALQRVSTWCSLILGACLTVGVGLLDGVQVTVSAPYLFLCGSLAICAMILPGLSGAFLLILLGAYEHMLQALVSFQWIDILTFSAGAACGLLAFSRVIAWVLKHYHEIAYAFICGLLLGSLYVLWPWQETVSSYLDTNGVTHPLRNVPVWPLNYAEVSGEQANVLAAVLVALAAIALVIVLHKASTRNSRNVAHRIDGE